MGGWGCSGVSVCLCLRPWCLGSPSEECCLVARRGMWAYRGGEEQLLGALSPNMWLLPLSWGTKGHKCCKGQKTIVSEVQCWFLQWSWLSPLWWPSVWCVRPREARRERQPGVRVPLCALEADGNMWIQYSYTHWYILSFYSITLIAHGPFS